MWKISKFCQSLPARMRANFKNSPKKQCEKRSTFRQKKLRKFQNVATKWPQGNATAFRQRNLKRTLFWRRFGHCRTATIKSIFFSKKKFARIFPKKTQNFATKTAENLKKRGKAPKSHQTKSKKCQIAPQKIEKASKSRRKKKCKKNNPKSLHKNVKKSPIFFFEKRSRLRQKKTQEFCVKKNFAKILPRKKRKIPKLRQENLRTSRNFQNLAMKMWRISKFCQSFPARTRANFKAAPKKISNASKKISKIRRRSKAKRDRRFAKKNCAGFNTLPTHSRKKTRQHLARDIWNKSFFDEFAATGVGPRRYILPSKI